MRPLRCSRTDDELRDRVVTIWPAHDDRHAELRAAMTRLAEGKRKVEMYHIGG